MKSVAINMKKLTTWAFAMLLLGATIAFTPQTSLAQGQCHTPSSTQYNQQTSWQFNDEEDFYQPLNPQQVYQLALRKGFSEGYQHGVEDGEQGLDFNFIHDVGYRRAVTGWQPRMGFLSIYKRAFKKGYSQGYSQGFNSVDNFDDQPNYSPFNR